METYCYFDCNYTSLTFIEIHKFYLVAMFCVCVFERARGCHANEKEFGFGVSDANVERVLEFNSKVLAVYETCQRMMPQYRTPLPRRERERENLINLPFIFYR